VLKHFLISIKLLPRKGKKFYCLIEKTTGILPKNPDYYLLALHHKSLMRRDDNGMPVNNERLEYLGDAVLGAVIAHELYARFPLKDEGALTKMRARIVNRTNMNRQALRLGLAKLIKTQPLADLAQTHIPGDALEALIGAIYLDRGYFKAREFILNKILEDQPNLEDVFETDSNYKSILIEWAQKNRCEIYFDAEEYINNHELTFLAHAYVNNVVMGQGKGTSKKEAQQNAAEEALNNVSERHETMLN
jgi:ribonuclease-3